MSELSAKTLTELPSSKSKLLQMHRPTTGVAYPFPACHFRVITNKERGRVAVICRTEPTHIHALSLCVGGARGLLCWIMPLTGTC